MTATAARKEGAGQGWLKLGLGIGMLFLLIFLVLPWLRQLPGIGPVMAVIEAADLDANHYFYTASEETVQAEIHVRHALARSGHQP